MHYYRIADVTLESSFQLASFGEFGCEPCEADMKLEETKELPPAGRDIESGSVIHRCTEDGWFFHAREKDTEGLFVSRDYTHLKLSDAYGQTIAGMAEWYVRIAIECMLARRGYVSLHSAAVDVNGEAFAFTGPSGVGKSTRATAWTEAFSTQLINGDRPLIDVRRGELYGVPWDGKEQCFRNVHYPLRAILEVRRSESVYIRTLSFSQRRKLLMRQCFMPMWDTETAAVQMGNIVLLAAQTDMVRVFCGPAATDARALYSVLQKHEYLKEEPDMKAKSGFILRNVVDEHILMPTGDNIGKFNGTVLLNDVSAFVWEKLQMPISREDLLKAILDEYEVEKTVASADLDILLETLRGYGVIEDD